MSAATTLIRPFAALRAHVARIPHPLRRALGAVAGIALGLAALMLAARGVDRQGLVDALAGVNGWWLAGAAAANAVTIIAQGFAWNVGLDAAGMGGSKARHAIAATWVGKAVNQVLPGKVGEVARIAMIRTHLPHERREISRIVGSVAAQRVLNGAALFLVVTLTASTIALPVELPFGRWSPLGALILVVVATVATTGILRRRPPSAAGGGAVRAFIGRLASGAGVLVPGRRTAAALGLHLVGVTAQVVMMACLLRAFDVSVGASAPLLIIVLFGLAGAMPGAPGGAGLNQAALVAPLGAVYGTSADSALAFSIGLQATILVVAVIGGLVATVHHRVSRAPRVAIP